MKQKPFSMKSSSKRKKEVLREPQLKALINLLSDEDPQVFDVVHRQFEQHRDEANAALRMAALSDDPITRKHAGKILTEFKKQDSDTEFLRFCLTQGEEFDLEEAAFLLSNTGVPDANKTAHQALLDLFARQIKERLAGISSGEQILATINEYLFTELGFHGNEDNYYEPQNSYLAAVIDRRTGNPISLSALYIFIGKRLRLPIVGIGLPGHFLCRYQSTKEEYYIDAFNEGKLLTKNDCIKFLVHTNHTINGGYLLPMSSRRILMRMCANLHQIYTETKNKEETERLQRYLIALAK